MAFHFTDLVFKVTTWTDARFTHIEKAVLNALATRADENGKCFPGFTCLVSDTGVSRGRLSDAIANIKELGLVEVEVGLRGKFRYALNENAISKFGQLEEKAQEAAAKADAKPKTIRGKNNKTYTRKPEVAPAAEKSLEEDTCDVCGEIECACPADDFKQFTCPKCEVTGLMTHEAYAKHVTICATKPKAATAPPIAKPVAQKPTVVPPPAHAPVEVPKVQCPMPHCTTEGSEASMEKHMATRSYACRECYKAYHTEIERIECGKRNREEYSAWLKAEKVMADVKWNALPEPQRREKWEKDKASGIQAGWKKCGRWTEGEAFKE